jgi:hypothetical protein
MLAEKISDEILRAIDLQHHELRILHHAVEEIRVARGAELVTQLRQMNR